MKDLNMLEENEDLEVQEKKPGKSWLFRIGLMLFILASGVLLLNFFLNRVIGADFLCIRPQNCFFECGCLHKELIIGSLGISGLLGLGLISIHYLKEFGKKKKLLGQIVVVLFILILIGSGLKWIDFSNMLAPINKNLAISTKNELFCSLPGITGYEEESCYLEVAKLRRDSRPCDKIDPTSQDSGECYTDIARVTKSETVCEKISDTAPQEHFRLRCYSELAQIKKDEKLCEKIAATGYREICYSEVAKVKGAPLCQRINGDEQRNFCISTAKQSRLMDISSCGLNDGCLFLVALVQSDPSACKGIDDSFDQAVCFEALK